MTTVELLSVLRSREVQLWVEGERLRYRAAKGALTPELRAELGERRQEIISFLMNSTAPGFTPPITVAPRRENFPLSFSQLRLWFLEQLVPGNTIFHINTAVCLTTPLNITALDKSLNEIVRRHEALRTTFTTVDGQPVQIIAAEPVMRLNVIDLRATPAAQREKEALRVANEEAQKPFDLTCDSLVRASLLRLDALRSVFLLTMHHIVSDGWSLNLFWEELTSIYPAVLAGRASPLPELPIQYADYAVWQRKWLQGEVLQSQLRYWKRHLADLPPLDLSTDRPRPPIQTFRGTQQGIELSESLTASLKRICQREGTTLFMVLLAAFEVLLSLYTGQKDFAVGTTIAGRRHTETERLIGFFVNTLVLRADLSGNPGFREVLRRVQEVTLGAYSYQDLPFEKLVEELQPERDLSRNPLFQVMLQLMNAPNERGAELSGSVLPTMDLERKNSIFDLAFSLWESPAGLRGVVEYNTDLFEATSIRRLVAHFQTLLLGIVAHPDKPVAEHELLTPAEREQLLAWNHTGADFLPDRSLVQLFEARSLEQSQAPAFIYGDDGLCYEELNRRANKLAHYLRRLGVGPEVLVGQCLERSPEMVIGLLAILKAGGVYLPLNPSDPAARLALILGDARVSIVITEQRFVDLLPGSKLRRVCIDAEQRQISLESESNPCCNISPEHLAYVIYTSGSTGRPKGVAAEHKQILNRLAWMWKSYPFRADEVCCQKTAATFVDSIWELLGPLLQGIPTVIIPESVSRDLDALVKVLAKNNITRIWVVPSLLRALLNTYPDLQDQLPRLKFWVTSGEALSPALFREFQKAMPQNVLYNLYGTSEVWDTTWFDPQLESWESETAPIGRPIANIETYVLNDQLQLAPIGVPAELHIGGAGLARGYLNSPALTAERFIPDPFSSVPGARLYGTGDSVRYLGDGNLEFIGRRDHQIKVRGFRIELSEVELAIEEHESVHTAVVTASKAGDGLVAYVVAKPAAQIEKHHLEEHLRRRLPDYMLPSALVMMEKLPLTSNGKIDRAGLPDASEVEPQTESTSHEPRNEEEKLIARMFAEVLKRERVGIHDDFFKALGGHSLLATQLVSRVRRAFEVELPLRSVFDQPTVAALAEVVSQLQQSADENGRNGRPSLVPIPREQHRISIFSEEDFDSPDVRL